MKITKLQTRLVNIPLDKPIRTAIHDMRSVGCVLVSVYTDQGLVGEGFCFSLNGVRLKAFDEVLKGYAPYVEGQDADFIEGIWESIYQSLNPMGQQGVTISALAALDTALWDLQGKALDKPLHRLWGACRNRVKTYASSGLWLSQSIDELVDEAQQFVDQGFRGMKIRVGQAQWRDDVERVKAVRETIGSDIELYADVNQALNPKQAIKLGQELEAFELAWLEEPVAANNLIAHAEVRNRLVTPIASGETVYTRYGIRAMIEAQACDVLMPDLQRMGGLSEMRKASALAASYDLPVSSHFFTEHSLCFAGSVANCISVEHISWFESLFNESMELVEGELVIPDRAGTGFTFRMPAD